MKVQPRVFFYLKSKVIMREKSSKSSKSSLTDVTWSERRKKKPHVFALNGWNKSVGQQLLCNYTLLLIQALLQLYYSLKKQEHSRTPANTQHQREQESTRSDQTCWIPNTFKWINKKGKKRNFSHIIQRQETPNKRSFITDNNSV